MDLADFAFLQACCVHQAARTCEREEILHDTPTRQTLDSLKATPQGQQFLRTVTVKEIERESQHFGSFAQAVTGDSWLPDHIIGTYLEKDQS